MSTGIEAQHPTFDLLGMDREIKRRAVRQRVITLAGWTGLAAIGIKKGGAIGLIGAGVGLFALVREVIAWRDEQPEWRKAAFRPPTVLRRLLRSNHRDPVDRASATSFPASDAPSHQGN